MKCSSCYISLRQYKPSILNRWYGINWFRCFKMITGQFSPIFFLTRSTLSGSNRTRTTFLIFWHLLSVDSLLTRKWHEKTYSQSVGTHCLQTPLFDNWYCKWLLSPTYCLFPVVLSVFELDSCGVFMEFFLEQHPREVLFCILPLVPEFLNTLSVFSMFLKSVSTFLQEEILELLLQKTIFLSRNEHSLTRW